MSVQINMNSGWEKEVDITSLMELVAQDVENDAKQFAPVRTGALRDSIRHYVEGTGEETVAYVGSDLEYSVTVELGTSTQSASPYLRPALDRKRNL